MNALSFIPVNVDLQVVANHVGSDLVMFVAAMLAYCILHKVRAASKAVPVKDKLACSGFDEAPVATEEKCLTKDAPKAVFKVQKWQPKPETAVIKPASTSGKPEQPKPAQPKPVTKAPEPKEPEVFDVTKHEALLQTYAAARNIKDTLATFRKIQGSGECLTSSMYNAVLRAWVKCGNIFAAENWMQEMKEWGLFDEDSFVILIKALVYVRDLDKARALLQDMKEVGVSPTIATFEELLKGFAKVGQFKDGISILLEMNAAGVQPTNFTLTIISKLVNSARETNQRSAEVKQILAKYDLEFKSPGSLINPLINPDPSQLPCLAAAIRQAENTDSEAAYVHNIEMKGTLAQIQALRQTLGEAGFIEGPQDGRIKDLGQVFSQTMSKTLRDRVQDKAYRERALEAIKCVCKGGVRFHAVIDVVIEYLGNDLYYLQVQFESSNSRADIFDSISCRHPRVGFRHCWVKTSTGSYGQRAIINGEESDDACFNRHINAVGIA